MRAVGRPPKRRDLRVLSGKLPMTRDNFQSNTQFDPPECPEHFTDIERAVWDKTINLLKGTCPLQRTDQAVLGAYCSSVVLWQKVEAELQKKGNKSSVNNAPLIRLSRNAKADMVRYAEELGMSPATRLRSQQQPQTEKKVNIFAVLRDMKDTPEMASIEG
jgi:P27 family predicted phage terminase small subunit